MTCSSCIGVCPGGTFETTRCTATANRVCAQCPAGSSCPGGAVRTPCGSDAFYSQAGKLSCTAAKVGEYTVGGTSITRTDVRQCEPGHQCQSGVRTACEAGATFQPLDAQGSCNPCKRCSTGLTATTTCSQRQDAICEDITAPIIQLNGQDLVVELGDAFEDPFGTARDSYDGTVTLTRQPVALPSTTGSYTLRYTATDKAGNKAEATRGLTIQDTTPPTLTLQGGATIDLEFKAAFTEPGYTASDKSTYTVTVAGVEALNIASQSGTSPGPFAVTYTACDVGGLCTTRTRQVYLTDSVVPVISLLGSNPTRIEVNTLASYSDAGATATDNVHGDLSEYVTVGGVGNVNVTRLGTYVVTFDLSYIDEVARQLTREVIVQDTTKPSVSLVGGARVTVEMGDAWVEPGYTASDNHDTAEQLQTSITPTTLSTRVANGTILTVLWMIWLDNLVH